MASNKYTKLAFYLPFFENGKSGINIPESVNLETTTSYRRLRHLLVQSRFCPLSQDRALKLTCTSIRFRAKQQKKKKKVFDYICE